MDGEGAIRAALDGGITLFDTADCYGRGASETLLGRCLPRDRDHLFVATKFGVRWDESGRTTRDTSPAHAKRAVEASLGRLASDVLDLVYVHWPDGRTPLEETVGALLGLKDEGKIRAIGLSNLDLRTVESALVLEATDAWQIPFSLLHLPPTEALERATELGIPVVAWGALAQGLLTGKYDGRCSFESDDRRRRYVDFIGDQLSRNLSVVDEVLAAARRAKRNASQVALRWTLDHPHVSHCLFGAKRPEQVDDNRASSGWRLSTKDYASLQAAAERLGNGWFPEALS
jgi:aryl-alcohol dehydrogenase-like predicted oxidoreductase